MTFKKTIKNCTFSIIFSFINQKFILKTHLKKICIYWIFIFIFPQKVLALNVQLLMIKYLKYYQTNIVITYEKQYF